jgi:hypothetical protein
VREYSDVIYVVWLHDEQCYGMLEKLGAFASVVKYNIGEEEVEELIENENFTIVDEIVHQHVEESN